MTLAATRWTLGLLLLLACSGCQTLGSGEAPPAEADIPTLETIDDAVAAFGIPNRLAYDESGERTLIWEYDLSKGQALFVGFPVWQLLGFVHRHRGFDRLEVELDMDDRVTGSFVVVVTDGYERRLDPWWNGEEPDAGE